MSSEIPFDEGAAFETPLVFDCHGESLVGILHPCSEPSTRGLLVVVGGPQYRAGSHRQFVLLARDLAMAGIPVFRFDYRGMGDSQGESRNFETIDEDIQAALDRFFAEYPALWDVVIWGLCDAAFAASVYAASDSRVKGLVLLNPWVRSQGGRARSYVKRYYFKRFFSIGFWGKISRGKFALRKSLIEFLDNIYNTLNINKIIEKKSIKNEAGISELVQTSSPLADRMLEGLRGFKGQVLFILSGNDLTAGEFKDAVAASKAWRRFLGSARVQRRDLVNSDHTFSRRAWKDQVSKWTLEWLKSW